jgi:hypothetical protein
MAQYGSQDDYKAFTQKTKSGFRARHGQHENLQVTRKSKIKTKYKRT